MRVLFLSWRDIEHPRAGGAELFTYEIARRMVAKGDTVEWFAAMFPGAKPETELGGVHVVRGGKQWSVHLAAIQRYRGRLKPSFDAVVDEVNTIPFFTPMWADVPRLILIFQLAREVWWYESAFPINAIGYLAEPAYLRAYRHTPAVTISVSTRIDLLRLGFVAPITILPIGLEPIVIPDEDKASITTFLYVGRMAKSKRVHDIVQAFALYRESGRSAQLWLVGDGPSNYVAAIRKQVNQLGLTRDIELLGRIGTREKHERMARAHVLLMASVREGWGLSVAEANACGTPAVAYDVPGLRDSIRDGETGLLVPPSPDRLAAGMVRLTTEPRLYSKLASEAKRWSSSFSFEAAADAMRTTIATEVTRRNPA